MSASKKKKINYSGVQTLSYPLAIHKGPVKELVATLKRAGKAANKYLQAGYNQEVLDRLATDRQKAYKVLEKELVKLPGLPSRINRGILEIVGRTLRACNDRRNLYKTLLAEEQDPHKWDYQRLIKQAQIYKKAQYVANIKEQTINYLEKHGQLPENYFQLQQCPRLKKDIISYAPDDGQAIKMEQTSVGLKIKIKVVDEKDENKWHWLEFELPLPDHLCDKITASPDLRLACIHGQWLPVLDYKIEQPCIEKQKCDNFITVDWGSRKLITVCIFNRNGEQVCPPIFLKFAPLQKKLFRLRTEIDRMKGKRDKLPKYSSKWRKYNREIQKRWRKFRAINKALAHLAANTIVLIAKIYDCDGIYIEYLKSLKSRNKSKSLNWLINSTVRQAIYNKVAYKANLLGLKLHKPLPPHGTSQYCPRCGHKGYHAKSPDKQNIKSRYGSWFVCPHCKFNADRDYVACCNIARKVLYGNSLKNQNKGIAYKTKPNSALLSRQSTSLFRDRLFHHFKGFKNSVFLRPKFFTGILKS